MTTSSGENRTGGHKSQFEESFYECDDHLLSGNENGSSNVDELNNIITFHLECCKGPCSHDNTYDDNASYDSDDSSMYSSGDSTSSIDLDDEDDLMEPASEGIEELKQQCIDAINNKLAAFPDSLRYALIERVRNADVGEIFYWCQGLCDLF
jgi:hypothetical protein